MFIAKIVIEIEDVNNASDACRYVADRIEEGYNVGLIGSSCDSWYIE